MKRYFLDGKVDVSSGVLTVSLKDPEGIFIASANIPLSLPVGASSVVDFPFSLPLLKLGEYELSYRQSDETTLGRPTITKLLNNSRITVALDKLFYRTRETATLQIDLVNNGLFNIENLLATMSLPDAGYTDRASLSLSFWTEKGDRCTSSIIR